MTWRLPVLLLPLKDDCFCFCSSVNDDWLMYYDIDIFRSLHKKVCFTMTGMKTPLQIRWISLQICCLFAIDIECDMSSYIGKMLVLFMDCSVPTLLSSPEIPEIRFTNFEHPAFHSHLFRFMYYSNSGVFFLWVW